MSRPRAPVFAYGTLTEPDRVDSILDDWRFDGTAVVDGLHPVEGGYPTLGPGGRTEGRLLATSQLDGLDAYEAVDAGLYVRLAVPVIDGDRSWLYVGDPDRLGVPVDWPGEGPFADRVRRYLDTATVRVRRTGNR